jgi:hypothetical protein
MLIDINDRFDVSAHNNQPRQEFGEAGDPGDFAGRQDLPDLITTERIAVAPDSYHDHLGPLLFDINDRLFRLISSSNSSLFSAVSVISICRYSFTSRESPTSPPQTQAVEQDVPPVPGPGTGG